MFGRITILISDYSITDLFKFLDKKSRTPTLCSAARNGRASTIRLLLRSSHFEQRDKNEALKAAAREAHLETMTVLLNQGADANADGWVLGCAAKSGKIEALELLTKHGADLRRHGEIALWCASANGYTSIVAFLLQNGADPDLKGLISYSLERGHADSATLLRQHTEKKRKERPNPSVAPFL